MRIVLDSLPYSWECEKNALVEKANNLKYNTIILELKEEPECQIQSGIRQSGKSMNALPWMKKMSGTLIERESAEREQEVHQINE